MSKFKTFKAVKPTQVILDQCNAAGVEVDDELHEQGSSDYIKIGSCVFFNTVNGRFFGKTPDGIEFTSDSNEHQRCDWFQQLLAFFYIEKE